MKYKTSRAMKNVEWESCQRKYGDIFRLFTEQCPSPEKAMLNVHAIKTRLDFATSSDSKISGFTRPHSSKNVFADSKISTLENGLKKLRIRMRIRRIRVDERRI